MRGSLKLAKSDRALIASAAAAEFLRRRWALLAQGFISPSPQDDYHAWSKAGMGACVRGGILIVQMACINVTNSCSPRSAIESRKRRCESLHRIYSTVAYRDSVGLLAGVLETLVTGTRYSFAIALSPSGLPPVNAIRVDGTVLRSPS
jgi:hypothetical protein